MIPNHDQFLQAVQDLKKVWIKFYSEPDSGVVERVCAPLAYGPGGGSGDGPSLYWLWDFQSPGPLHTLGLRPKQIVELSLLGESFDASALTETPAPTKAPADRGTDPSPVVVAGDSPVIANPPAP